MSTSPPPTPGQRPSSTVAVFITAAGVGLVALVASLLGSNSVVPRASVGMVSHGIVYLASGIFSGLLFPRYYWTTVLGLCSAVFAMALVFDLLMLSAGSIQNADRDMMFYGTLVMVASFAGASAGVAAGRRLRRSR